jgi:hypothetical protein
VCSNTADATVGKDEVLQAFHMALLPCPCHLQLLRVLPPVCRDAHRLRHFLPPPPFSPLRMVFVLLSPTESSTAPRLEQLKPMHCSFIVVLVDFRAFKRVTALSTLRNCTNDTPSACLQACARIGRTGWNAYTVNLDFRTGTHTDGKNVPGSLSALIILETGRPFAGGLYMLPQYHVGIALRQGSVLFHRSGDPEVGLHGNSAIHLPEPSSHRIAVVLYQTRLHTAKHVESSLARSLGIPAEVLSAVETNSEARASDVPLCRQQMLGQSPFAELHEGTRVQITEKQNACTAVRDSSRAHEGCPAAFNRAEGSETLPKAGSDTFRSMDQKPSTVRPSQTSTVTSCQISPHEGPLRDQISAASASNHRDRLGTSSLFSWQQAPLSSSSCAPVPADSNSFRNGNDPLYALQQLSSSEQAASVQARARALLKVLQHSSDGRSAASRMNTGGEALLDSMVKTGAVTMSTVAVTAHGAAQMSAAGSPLKGRKRKRQDFMHAAAHATAKEHQSCEPVPSASSDHLPEESSRAGLHLPPPRHVINQLQLTKQECVVAKTSACTPGTPATSALAPAAMECLQDACSNQVLSRVHTKLPLGLPLTRTTAADRLQGACSPQAAQSLRQKAECTACPSASVAAHFSGACPSEPAFSRAPPSVCASTAAIHQAPRAHTAQEDSLASVMSLPGAATDLVKSMCAPLGGSGANACSTSVTYLPEGASDGPLNVWEAHATCNHSVKQPATFHDSAAISGTPLSSALGAFDMSAESVLTLLEAARLRGSCSEELVLSSPKHPEPSSCYQALLHGGTTSCTQHGCKSTPTSQWLETSQRAPGLPQHPASTHALNDIVVEGEQGCPLIGTPQDPHKLTASNMPSTCVQKCSTPAAALCHLKPHASTMLPTISQQTPAFLKSPHTPTASRMSPTCTQQAPNLTKAPHTHTASTLQECGPSLTKTCILVKRRSLMHTCMDLTHGGSACHTSVKLLAPVSSGRGLSVLECRHGHGHLKPLEALDVQKAASLAVAPSHCDSDMQFASFLSDRSRSQNLQFCGACPGIPGHATNVAGGSLGNTRHVGDIVTRPSKHLAVTAAAQSQEQCECSCGMGQATCSVHSVNSSMFVHSQEETLQRLRGGGRGLDLPSGHNANLQCNLSGLQHCPSVLPRSSLSSQYSIHAHPSLACNIPFIGLDRCSNACGRTPASMPSSGAGPCSPSHDEHDKVHSAAVHGGCFAVRSEPPSTKNTSYQVLLPSAQCTPLTAEHCRSNPSGGQEPEPVPESPHTRTCSHRELDSLAERPSVSILINEAPAILANHLNSCANGEQLHSPGLWEPHASTEAWPQLVRKVGTQVGHSTPRSQSDKCQSQQQQQQLRRFEEFQSSIQSFGSRPSLPPLQHSPAGTCSSPLGTALALQRKYFACRAPSNGNAKPQDSAETLQSVERLAGRAPDQSECNLFEERQACCFAVPSNCTAAQAKGSADTVNPGPPNTGSDVFDSQKGRFPHQHLISNGGPKDCVADDRRGTKTGQLCIGNGTSVSLDILAPQESWPWGRGVVLAIDQQAWGVRNASQRIAKTCVARICAHEAGPQADHRKTQPSSPPDVTAGITGSLHA